MNPVIITTAMNHVFGELSSPNTLILGFGESGLAMAKWGNQHGAQIKIHDTRHESTIPETLLEKVGELRIKGITQISSGEIAIEELLNGIDLIGMSPGLSPNTPYLKNLLEHAKIASIPVWGELEFFTRALNALKAEFEYAPKLIAITGTNGKTTTTALTGTICKHAQKSVAIAGNISPSLLDKLSELISDQQELPEIWVLELSSFQLFYSLTFNPDAATILNVTQDHLDWHGDMDHYFEAKTKVFGEQTIAILNRDDKRVIDLLKKTNFDNRRVITFGVEAPFEADSFGITGDMNAGGIDWLAWIEPPLEDESIGKRKRRTQKVNAYDEEPLRIKRLIPVEALLIKGRHNAANTLAALALANAIGLGMGQLLHGLRSYHGEPHRVQTIGIVDDVEYIDDSKGTNVGATIAALRGIGHQHQQEYKKIILIIGGDGKGQDFSPLQLPIEQFAKKVILIGKDASLIEHVVKQTHVPYELAQSLEDAVHKAADSAKTGNCVLLSPACASFDMFKNYAHRAEVFLQAVNDLELSKCSSGVSI